jgi:hypothetical protein
VQQNAEREKVQAQITVAQAKANAVRAEARPTMAGVAISGMMEQMPQGSKMERNPARRLCEAG